jgi:hypothetical protein
MSMLCLEHFPLIVAECLGRSHAKLNQYAQCTPFSTKDYGYPSADGVSPPSYSRSVARMPVGGGESNSLLACPCLPSFPVLKQGPITEMSTNTARMRGDSSASVSLNLTHNFTHSRMLSTTSLLLFTGIDDTSEPAPAPKMGAEAKKDSPYPLVHQVT